MLNKKTLILFFTFLFTVTLSADIDLNNKDGYIIIDNKTFKLKTSNFGLDEDEKFTPKITLNFLSSSQMKFKFTYEGNFLVLDNIVPSAYETRTEILYAEISYKF